MSDFFATEPLARMLKSIALQKRTGLLCVERLGVRNAEKGEMYFEAGRPLRVRVGQEVGQDAFQRICTWTAITCTFESLNRPLPVHTHTDATEPRSTPQQTEYNVPAIPPAKPRQIAPPAASLAPVPAPVPENRETPRPRGRWNTRPLTPSPSSLAAVPATPRPGGLPPSGALPSKQAVFQIYAPDTFQQTVRQLERYDRVIFVLLDGRRTVEDIARLTHYSEVEVGQVLARLSRSGYVERVFQPHQTPSLNERISTLFTTSLPDHL